MNVFNISAVQVVTYLILILAEFTNSLNEICFHQRLKKNGKCIYYGNCATEKLVSNNYFYPQFCGKDKGYLIACCPAEDDRIFSVGGTIAEQKCNEYGMLYQQLKGRAKRSVNYNQWNHHNNHWDRSEVNDHWEPNHHFNKHDWQHYKQEDNSGDYAHQANGHRSEHDYKYSFDNDMANPKYSYDNMFRWKEYGNYKTFWAVDDIITDYIKTDTSTMPPENNSGENTDTVAFRSSVDKLQAIGGIDAEVGQFPHMVALGYGTKNAIIWGCGGSLISERFVLTAAHCITPAQLGRVKYAQMGVIRLDPLEKIYYVKQTYLHIDYNPRFFYNDIALVELTESVTFTSSIIPACLFVDKGNQNAFKDFKVNALGSIIEEGTGARLLQTVNLQHFAECSKLLRSERLLPRGVNEDTQICFGHKTKERDVCKGDSGGPLHYFNNTFRIIGITSFGKSDCGIINVPAVYTRVSFFIDWIESIVWK